MRFLAILACAAALVSAQTPAPKATPPAQANPAPQAQLPGRPVPQSPEKPLLPSAFSGWVTTETPKTVSDPAQIDPANAAALKEYGFESATTATYKRDDETLTLKALRFPDVSGSFGAYGFYRDAKWPKAEIGSGAASNGNRVLFWRGAILVDATFSTVRPESASELRELADTLPVASGNKALPPPILSLLPKSDREDQTAHYVKGPDGFTLIPGKGLEGLSPRYALGPAGYTGSGGVLPASLVGFDRDAETVTASYTLSSGPATLTLISYPTPQMATAAEAQIRAYIQSGGKGQTPFTQLLKDSDLASLEVRRTGPIVALVSGDAIPDESHKLIETVHYSSDLTKVPMPGISEVAKTGSLLFNIAMFVVIIGGAAILLGLFLGGGRALYRKARGKPISSVYEAEFTRLDLRD
jgi:hypothetical protein